MATEIELPDGTILEAPDGADPSVVAKGYLARQQSQQPAVPQQPRSLAPRTEEVMSRLGFGGAIKGAADVGLAGLRGTAHQLVGTTMGLGGALHQAGNAIGIPGARPGMGFIQGRDAYMQAAGDDALPVKGSQLRTPEGQRVAEAISNFPIGTKRTVGDVGRAIDTGLGKLNPVVRDVGTSAVTLATMRAPRMRAPQAPISVEPAIQSAPAARSPRTPAPSVSDLKTQAGAAYDAAEGAGLVVSKDSLAAAVERIRQKAAEQKIDATLHPDSLAALKKLMESTSEHVSIGGLESLRRVVSDAASSPKPADRRMAMLMRDELDNYANNLGTADVLGAADPGAAISALRQGRDLWNRARKGEIIEEIMRKAEVGRSKFSMSGLENSLRNDFRALARNNKKMRQFTAAERAAIERVAKGGDLGNLLRDLGKYAPTGIIPAIMGAAAGFAVGGPVGAIAVPAAGALARYGATKLTKRNALAASELARRGPRNELSRPQETSSNALTRR